MIHHINKAVCTAALLTSLILPLNAQAQNNISSATLTQETAKQYGLIGELPNGLVGHVEGAYKDAYVVKLIDDINDGRMLIYQTAARKKRLPVEYIQVRAGDEFMKKVGPGQYYYKNSKWIKR